MSDDRLLYNALQEIDLLRAENEKLRAATLEDAANVADVKARTVGNGRDEYSLACRHIARELRAAAAHKETEECSTSST